MKFSDRNGWHSYLDSRDTCKVTVRFSKVESGGKWSFIPGSVLETSRVPADVREQLSFTGRDTTINQENWRTVQQAS